MRVIMRPVDVPRQRDAGTQPVTPIAMTMVLMLGRNM